MSRGLVLLGATGSIGRSTLALLRQEDGDEFRLQAVTAWNNRDGLRALVREFRPQLAAIRPELAAGLQRDLAEDGIDDCVVLAGDDGFRAAALCPTADTVISAMVGRAGLAPTLAALEAGRRVLLANKESLVIGGELVREACRLHGGSIIPVDSEHSAIWQLLDGRPRDEIRRLILTASGGPFLHTPAEELARVTAADALRHPTWRMGAKITIDSATLMNKGLEVIEAVRLFDFPAERVHVVVHPQSLIHSLIEFVDGSHFAQLGGTDMKHPIHYALHWPTRRPLPGAAPFSLPQLPALTFEEPDRQRFPCLDLALTALSAGGTALCVLNAANEVAVAAFLKGIIDFPGIPRLIERALARHRPEPVRDLSSLLELDGAVRKELSAELGMELDG